MRRPHPPRVLGNSSLTRFDVLVVGSGAGGSAAAEMLTRHGQKVLILEAGSNFFHGLDDPDPAAMSSLFSNDEVKLTRRWFIDPDPLVEPRTFRRDESDGPRRLVGDVNGLPKLVGGGAVHSNLTTLRFQPFDFTMGSRLAGRFPDADFADWPLDYEELEPFYVYSERMLGVQGDGGDNPFEPPRSAPYPMPPGPDMAIGALIGEAARRAGHHPYLTPHAITSRPYDGRPACVGCGFCGRYGCPTGAKGSPAVTSLRRALLSGNALLLAETRAVKLHRGPDRREIAFVEAIGPDGERVSYRADRYVLAASPIEDVRLLFLSGDGDPLGNSSGLVGRNLMFHLLTSTAAVFEQRLHGHRGKTSATGFADFRGHPDDASRPLGGIVLVNSSGEPILESTTYTRFMRARGPWLDRLLRESPIRDRMLVLTMYGEDAPQARNRVDLDPDVRDLDGLPVARITYRSHAYELAARERALPKLMQLTRAAGSRFDFRASAEEPSESRHIMGTLRFGTDPKRSVCDRTGRLHDFGNLYAADGALFPTSSGWNPVLTVSTLGSWVGASMLEPAAPARRLAYES